MKICKNCQSNKIAKNGFVRGTQRYKCKECGYNFIEGDKRFKEKTKIKKALAVILYSMGGASLRFIARLFGTNVSLVYRWIKSEGKTLKESDISGEIKEIEFDEMWHFIKSKKTKNGLSKPWIVTIGEPLHGLSAIVMLQHSNDSIKK